jgi:hypothetical protein
MKTSAYGVLTRGIAILALGSASIPLSLAQETTSPLVRQLYDGKWPVGCR